MAWCLIYIPRIAYHANLKNFNFAVSAENFLRRKFFFIEHVAQPPPVSHGHTCDHIRADICFDPDLCQCMIFSGSADEDSGVGGSPTSRPATHNCTMCNKKFSRADILRKHMKTHTSSSCTVCGQIFNDKVALAKHQVEVGHSIIPGSRLIKKRKFDTAMFHS